MFDRQKDISPIDAANNLTPRWMRHIQDFGSLEIKTSQFAAGSGETGDVYFWTVYGRYKPNGRKGGLEVFDDFETEGEARQFYDKLIEAFPHLAGEQKPIPRSRRELSP